MTFKKGCTPWNKGLTKEIDSRIDYERPTTFKKGQPAYNTGKPLSEEQKLKLSKSLKGKTAWNKGKYLSDEHKRNLRGIPKPRTEEQNKKLSATIQGISYEEWEGFKSSERQKEWNSKEWQLIRKAVFERDDYTCQECGDHNYAGRGKSIKIECHHKKEWINFPELRMDLDNLITLCANCHNKTKKGAYTNLDYIGEVSQ
jgi:5-methylcytosine-specific restriction enzyme A